MERGFLKKFFCLFIFSLNLQFNLAFKNKCSRALAQAAARIWLQIGHAEYAQRAQQLVATLQGGAPSAENTGQAAFEAFQRANSADAMRQAVAQYPILITPQFIAVIERVIVTQVAPELKPAFQERLATLKRIAQSP